MALILTVLLVALIFEYINGFHDTANSIATVVSTKVLTPRAAIILAAITNLWGALGGTVWNLITWWFGLPSSSSHALVGGLIGAVLASSHNAWNSVIWIKTIPG